MAKKKKSGKKAATKKAAGKETSGSRHRRIGSGAEVVKGPGSMHLFDLGFTTDLAKAAVFRKFQLRQADIEFCKALGAALAASNPSSNWIKEFTKQRLYRVCSPSRNPLDAAATFAAGGRCNYGMAQRCEEFPELIASFGIYASLDAKTASIEAASGISSPTEVTFEIEKNDGSALRLIDYDAVVAFLDSGSMGLVRIVAEAPYNAEWSLQKNPKPSQMIGNWLMCGLMDEADGLFFYSTKNPVGKNVLIFASSANGLEASYTARQI